jgi:hypothetical protein
MKYGHTSVSLTVECYGIACLRLSKLLLRRVSLRNIEISSHGPKLFLQLALVTVDCIGLCVSITLYNAVLCISDAV